VRKSSKSTVKRPAPKKAAASRTPAKQKAFLAAFALCGNISTAAKAAKICRTDHYDWLADPSYAATFESAQQEACEHLEAEARRRAVEGIQKPVIYQGELSCKRDSLGRRTRYPLTIREYSDTLLIFLMKGAMPQKYRDNAKIELSGEVNLVERLAAGRARVAKRDAEQQGGSSTSG